MATTPHAFTVSHATNKVSPQRRTGETCTWLNRQNVGEFSFRTNRQHASVRLSQHGSVRNIWQNTDFSCWFTHVVTIKECHTWTATTNNMKRYRPYTQSIIWKVWRRVRKRETREPTPKCESFKKKQPLVAWDKRVHKHTQSTRQLKIKHHHTSCSETAEMTQNSTLKSDEWTVSIMLSPWLKNCGVLQWNLN